MNVMPEGSAPYSGALWWRELDMQGSQLRSRTLKAKPFVLPLRGFRQFSAPRWDAVSALRRPEHSAIPASLSHRSDARAGQEGMVRGTEPTVLQGDASQAGGGDTALNTAQAVSAQPLT